MRKRRRFSAEFKAHVALDAPVGDKTLAELVGIARSSFNYTGKGESPRRGERA